MLSTKMGRSSAKPGSSGSFQINRCAFAVHCFHHAKRIQRSCARLKQAHQRAMLEVRHARYARGSVVSGSRLDDGTRLGAVGGAQLHRELVAPHSGAGGFNTPSRLYLRRIVIRIQQRDRGARGYIAVRHTHDVAFAPAIFEKRFHRIRQIAAADEVAERGLKLPPRLHRGRGVQRPPFGDSYKRSDIGAQCRDGRSHRISALVVNSRCQVCWHAAHSLAAAATLTQALDHDLHDSRS